MLKKFLLASVIGASLVSAAYANPAPYVGAGLGIINTSSSGGIGQSGNFRGVPLNVFAGYGGIVNQNIYLAGEVFGTVATGELSGKNKLKTTYGYGASIIPGVMLSEHTMAYARAGIVRGHFTSVHKTSTGAQAGLGLQASVTQNVDVRGEYDYDAYKTVRGVKSPRTDALNLGLVYKFE